MFFETGRFCTSSFYFCYHWLLKGQFCTEMVRFQSCHFQLINGASVFWKRFLFFRKFFRVLKTFKVPNDCFKRSPISETKDYFEKCFPVKRQRQTQILPQNLLTGAPVHFLSIWWINFFKNPYSLTSDSGMCRT